MVEMKKLRKEGVPFLTDQDIFKAVKESGTSVFRIETEPVLEHSDQYDTERYAVEGVIFFSKDHKVYEKRKWTMNATSSDYLMEKIGTDSSKWPAHEIELETIRTSTSQGMKNVIYPVGAVVSKPTSGQG